VPNELRRLAAEMNRQLEIQEQRSTVCRSDLASGLYPVRYFEQGGSQIAQSTSEREDQRSEGRFQGQQSNAFGNAYSTYSNRTPNTQPDVMEVSEVYYPARFNGKQDVLSPEQKQAEGSFQEERRQVEGRSEVHFGKMEQQPSEPVYKLV